VRALGIMAGIHGFQHRQQGIITVSRYNCEVNLAWWPILGVVNPRYQPFAEGSTWAFRQRLRGCLCDLGLRLTATPAFFCRFRPAQKFASRIAAASDPAFFGCETAPPL